MIEVPTEKRSIGGGTFGWSVVGGFPSRASSFSTLDLRSGWTSRSLS